MERQDRRPFTKNIAKYAFLKDIIKIHIRKCPFSKKQNGKCSFTEKKGSLF